MANDEPNQSNSGADRAAGSGTPAGGAGNSNRRQIILGAGAIIVIGIAGGAYYLWPSAALPELKAAPKQPDADPNLVAELMKSEALPDIAMGSAKAPVTIIEYASLGCSHCAHFNEATFPDLKKRYIDTGKVRYILRDFPLDDTAAMAFVFAHCAGNGDSGKYFSIVDTMFRQQAQWYVNDPTAPLMAIAKQAGFTEESFKACVTNQKAWDAMTSVRERAVTKFGVNSTPTFFINGSKLVGAVSIDEMAKVIDPYLKG